MIFCFVECAANRPSALGGKDGNAEKDLTCIQLDYCQARPGPTTDDFPINANPQRLIRDEELIRFGGADVTRAPMALFDQACAKPVWYNAE